MNTVPLAAVDLKGIEHYIGHPCTKQIIEGLGAVPAVSRTFHGLHVGEAAICVPIKHNRNSRKHRYTRANQIVTVDDLCFRILKRIR